MPSVMGPDSSIETGSLVRFIVAGLGPGVWVELPVWLPPEPPPTGTSPGSVELLEEMGGVARSPQPEARTRKPSARMVRKRCVRGCTADDPRPGRKRLPRSGALEANGSPCGGDGRPSAPPN